MKKIIFVIACAILFMMPAKAQSNHIYIGANDAAVYTIGFGLGSAFGSVISGPAAKETVSLSHYGCYSLTYERDLGKSGFSLGGTLAAMPTTYKVTKMETQEIVSQKSNCYFMALADGRFSYLRRKKFNLFSQVQLGAVSSIDEINEYKSPSSSTEGEENALPLSFAFQVNPIGIRFGGSHLGGYVAVGIGNLGVFSAGLSFDF